MLSLLCRIFYPQDTESSLWLASGHVESFPETKPCSPPQGAATHSTRDLLFSAQRRGSPCPFPGQRNLPASVQGITVLRTPKFHGWQPVSAPWPGSDRKQVSTFDTHSSFPSIAFSSPSFFWSESPSSPVTFPICSYRWCYPEKSKSLVSPNLSWFTWFFLPQSSGENKQGNRSHILKHREATAHIKNALCSVLGSSESCLHRSASTLMLPWMPTHVYNNWQHLQYWIAPDLPHLVSAVSNHSNDLLRTWLCFFFTLLFTSLAESKNLQG